MSTPSTRLMDLPPELLHEICSGLDTKTLLRLSQMCRGLFHTTQPIIFRHQIVRLQRLANSGDLTTRPSKEIQNLMGHKDLPLDYVQLNLSNSSSWKTLHSYYGLFSRMDYVGHIDIHLSLGHIWKHPDAAVSWWFQLAAVMNAIVGKSGSVLTVTGGSETRDHWPFSYTLTRKSSNSTNSPTFALPSASIRNPIPVLRQFFQLFESLRTKFSASKSIPVETPLALTDAPSFHMSQKIKISQHNLPRHPSPLLHALHINGNQLLHLPFFTWTIDTINQSPITCLSFQKTDLRHDEWAYVLRHITIPTLSELSLGSSQVAFPDLQLFFERHPSITIVNLMGGTAIGPLEQHSSKHLLPRLKEFSGDPEYAEHFLQAPDAHPNLNHITMSSEFGIISFEYQYSRFDDVFKLVAQRERMMTIILLLQSEVGLLNWLKNSSCPLITNIESLEIRAEGRFFLSGADKCAIYDWLGRFPSLIHFKINASFGVPGSALDMNELFWDKLKLLETVQCGRDIYQRPL